MKITKEHLKQVIQEELEEMVRGGEAQQAELERHNKSPEATEALNNAMGVAELIRAAVEGSPMNDEVFKLTEELKNAVQKLFNVLTQ